MDEQYSVGFDGFTNENRIGIVFELSDLSSIQQKDRLIVSCVFDYYPENEVYKLLHEELNKGQQY